MKVLVCGGRDFNDRELVARTLAGMGEITEIIEGGARGADSLGRSVGEEFCIPVVTFPARWATHGKAAGPIRNKQMLDEGKPDIVVAFPGGRGTQNMINQAEKAGVEVVRITETPKI